MGQNTLALFLVRWLATTEECVGDRTEDGENDWVLLKLGFVTRTLSLHADVLLFFVDSGVEPALERLAEEATNSVEPSSASCYQ